MSKFSKAFLLGTFLSTAVLSGTGAFAKATSVDSDNAGLIAAQNTDLKIDGDVDGKETLTPNTDIVIRQLGNGCFTIEKQSNADEGGLVIPAQVICPMVKQ